MLMTAKMMLDYLDMEDQGARLEKAIGEVLSEGKVLTYDVLRDFRHDPNWEKNAASTIEMAAAVGQKLNPAFTGKRLEEAKAKAKEMCDPAKIVGFED
jgi:isocitrate/isopropylmalate dehydrogenase